MSEIICHWIRGQKSFRVCGITVRSDGSEDREISCIKENGVASDAKTIIEQKTARDVQGEQDDDNDDNADPFNSEDDEELKDNDVVVEDDGEDEDWYKTLHAPLKFNN